MFKSAIATSDSAKAKGSSTSVSNVVGLLTMVDLRGLDEVFGERNEELIRYEVCLDEDRALEVITVPSLDPRSSCEEVNDAEADSIARKRGFCI